MWIVIKNRPEVVLVLTDGLEPNQSSDKLAKTGMIYSHLTGNTPIYEVTRYQNTLKALWGGGR